ncbi:MAG: hypothetical protein IJB68_07630 [Ruminococcus sp.]|nr:hypothetical protein [Ruminococcus sp.]
MKKKILGLLTGTAFMLSLSVAPFCVNAATPEEAAALARSMGLPESLIQAGWNKYYEDPSMYPPELIDSYMATLRGMNQEMINQLLIDNGMSPATPPAPVITTATQSSTESTITTTIPVAGADNSEESNNNSSSGNTADTSKNDKITITLPNGSTFDRISSKEFAAMSLDEKRAYIASLTPEQKTAFLSNMSPEDYKSLLKQLPIDNKAEIIDGMADITNQLGLTLNVEELNDSNIILSMKDKDGKLVALSAASDTVAATGYDRRGILALAAAITSLGLLGTAFIVKKSFGNKEV